MRGVAAVAAAFLVAAVLLSGCSGSPRAPAEVVVQSQRGPDEVHSSNGTAAASVPPPRTRGHIAGVVVDEAVRPIAGAKVRLPGLDLVRTTDRDGAFGFVDLLPGPYYLTVNATGYDPAETVLEVKEDQFTRAKVVLSAVPSPEPYHATQKFEGFADASAAQDDPFQLGLLCSSCTFDFYIDRPNLKDVVVEAARATVAQGDGFYHELRNYTTYAYASSGDTGDPLRVEVQDKDLGQGDRFHLVVEPTSFPAPETNVRFTVFVTAFYNQPAPTGWSLVGGST